MSRGPVGEFESAFAGRFGADRAFAFWRGRVALYAILRALGLGTDDEVVLPGYTCVVDANPVKYLGAKPVYVDIDPVTYNVLPEQVEMKITSRTKVIVAQHTYGYPCEMDALMDIADRHGIPVIEDCCHALGSKYRGEVCGTFGVAAFFSFQWNKPFSTGIGGMAVTNDAELAGRIETLCEAELQPPSSMASEMLNVQRLGHDLLVYPQTTALAASLFRWLTKKNLVIGSSSTGVLEASMAEDFFMGMSASQARAGLRQLAGIEDNLAHRRRMQTIYDGLFAEANWPIPQAPDYMDPVMVRYPVRVGDKQRAIARAPGRFVELGTWFECPLHPIQTPLDLYDYHEGMCPVAQQAAREVVNLPTHSRANERVARQSVDFVLDIGPAR